MVIAYKLAMIFGFDTDFKYCLYTFLLNFYSYFINSFPKAFKK